MEGPFVCYRELIAPTNISVAVFFMSSTEQESSHEYLLTGTVSTLSIYKLHATKSPRHLCLCCQYPLFGKLQDAKVFTSSQFENSNKSNSQNILLSFDLGKFVILQFNPNKNCLTELRIFNVEENNAGPGSEVRANSYGSSAHSEPYTVISEDQKLACCVVYSKQLYFIPLSSISDKELTLTNMEKVLMGKTNSSSPFIRSQSPFLIDVQVQLLLPGPIVDCCFLPGFSQPTLAILQNTAPVPIGHAAHVMHTCTITVIAVCESRNTGSILWQQHHLPHDSICLVKLTDPIMKGQVALVSMNALLIVSEIHIIGVPFNGFASTTVHSKTICLQSNANPSAHANGLEMDSSRWIEADPLCLVGCLKSGELLAIQIIIASKTSCHEISNTKFEISLLAKSVSSCSDFAVSCNNDFWFLSSRQSDGVLLSVEVQSTLLLNEAIANLSNDIISTPTATAAPTTAAAGTMNTNSISNIAISTIKRNKKSSTKTIIVPTDLVRTQLPRTLEMSNEEKHLYGEIFPLIINQEIPNYCRGGRNFTLEAVETLSTLGPVLSGMFTTADTENINMYEDDNQFDWISKKSPKFKNPDFLVSTSKLGVLNKIAVDPRTAKDSLILSTGVEETGALAHISYGIHMTKLTSREIPGALTTTSIQIHGSPYSLLLVGLKDKTRIYHADSRGVDGTRNSHHHHIFKKLETRFEELAAAEIGLVSSDTTLGAGVLHSSGRVIAQICSEVIRVVRLSDKIQSITLTTTHNNNIIEEKQKLATTLTTETAEAKTETEISAAEVAATEVEEMEEEVVEEVEALQDIVLQDSEEVGGLGGITGEKIIFCDASIEGYVLVLTSLRTLFLMKYDIEQESLLVLHRWSHSNIDITTATDSAKTSGITTTVATTKTSATNGTDRANGISDIASDKNENSKSVNTNTNHHNTNNNSTNTNSNTTDSDKDDKDNNSNDQAMMEVEAELNSTSSVSHAIESLLTKYLVSARLYRGSLPSHEAASAAAEASLQHIDPSNNNHNNTNRPSSNNSNGNSNDNRNSSNNDELSSELAVPSEELYLYGETIPKTTTTTTMITADQDHKQGQMKDSVDAVMVTPSSKSKASITTTTAAAAATTNSAATANAASAMSGRNSDQNDNGRLYIIMSDMLGNIAVISLPDDHDSTSATSATDDQVSINYINVSAAADYAAFSSTPSFHNSTYNNRVLCDAQLCILADNRNDESVTSGASTHSHSPSHSHSGFHTYTATSPLCLVVLFDNGDLLLYQCINSDAPLFSKIDHTVITHRSTQSRNCNKMITSLRNSLMDTISDQEKSPRDVDSPFTKKADYFSINGKHSSEWKSSYFYQNYNDHNGDNNNDFNKEKNPLNMSNNDTIALFEELGAYRLNVSPIMNSTAVVAVLIPGVRPAVVVNNKGRSTVLPLSLPDVPYVNPGGYILNYIRVGTVNSVVSLWHEDVSEFQHIMAQHTGVTVTVTKPAVARRVLGIYYESGCSTLYNNSVATVIKTEVGSTIHFCAEILPKTDDKTENALLQTKTHVLACSNTVKRPFTPKVLTDEEMKIEEESYDRFLPDLTSFCQPNETIAPAPLLEATQHKIVLSQGKTAIDEYNLKVNEQVLGIEVMYLNTEKMVDPILTIHQLMAVPFIKPHQIAVQVRRAFVAVSTLISNKHGDDTQGEGRVMLFSLDYKRFDNTETIAGLSTTADLNTTTGQAAATAGAGVTNESNSNNVDNQDKKVIEITSISSLFPHLSQHGMSTTMLSQAAESATQSKFFNSIQPKLKLHWQGPGPASVVKQMGEYLISTIGYCVYIYKLNKNTLEMDQVSFHFAQFYVSSVSVIKNYILIADVCNSVQFLVWRDEDYSLTLLAKDFDSRVCLSTSFISDGARLGIVLSDAESNLQLLQFNPRKLESRDGSKLLSLADFHLGSDANILLSHNLLSYPVGSSSQAVSLVMGVTQPQPPGSVYGGPLHSQSHLQHSQLMPPPPPPPLPMGRPSVTPGKRRLSSSVLGESLLPSAPFGTFYDKFNPGRSCILVGTVDGAVGVLLPVDERTYRTLSLLQQLMTMAVRTACLLNQKDFRQVKSSFVRLEKKRGVLDGTLLWRYATLPVSLQNDLALVIGTTADAILEHLAKLDTLISFF